MSHCNDLFGGLVGDLIFAEDARRSSVWARTQAKHGCVRVSHVAAVAVVEIVNASEEAE